MDLSGIEQNPPARKRAACHVILTLKDAVNVKNIIRCLEGPLFSHCLADLFWAIFCKLRVNDGVYVSQLCGVNTSLFPSVTGSKLLNERWGGCRCFVSV